MIVVDPIPMPLDLAVSLGAIAALGLLTLSIGEIVAYRRAERRYMR